MEWVLWLSSRANVHDDAMCGLWHAHSVAADADPDMNYLSLILAHLFIIIHLAGEAYRLAHALIVSAQVWR